MPASPTCGPNRSLRSTPAFCSALVPTISSMRKTDAGKRVGHLVAGNYLDYIEIDGPYNVVKIHTPLYAVGRNIEDVQVHDKYGVTAVGIKAPARNSSTVPRN